MEQELKNLHDAIVAQLKETATQSYNAFSCAYELLNEDKNASKEKFINIISNNDYVIQSLEFYNERFKGLDRSEDYLYIGQILTLQIKASQNLFVIARSESNEPEMNYYLSKKDDYKKELYFYYLLAGDNEKIKIILEAFVKDSEISENIILLAENRYKNYINQ